MLARPLRNDLTQRTSIKEALPGPSPSAGPGSSHTAVIYGADFLPGAGLHSLLAVVGIRKELFLNLLNFDHFST